MSTFLGIALDNWVNIDRDCPMSVEIVQREIQIELGHGASSLHLVLTEEALVKLANITDSALRQVRGK
jgi:hypothetical protein